MISDTYLALFLAQLQQEGMLKCSWIHSTFLPSEKYAKGLFCTGYSIFVIRGNLPECEAEQILKFMRVQQQQRPKLIGEEEAQTSAGYGQWAKIVQVTQKLPRKSFLFISDCYLIEVAD